MGFKHLPNDTQGSPTWGLVRCEGCHCLIFSQDTTFHLPVCYATPQ